MKRDDFVWSAIQLATVAVLMAIAAVALSVWGPA